MDKKLNSEQLIQEMARLAALRYIEDCRQLGILDRQNMPIDIGEFIQLTNLFSQELIAQIQENI
ncbi:MAG TPA: hypothetical protein VI522_02730 [Gammaproteobacteria bacterium]|nr:hypothetical protein [Gammaproteobacteria bacterium]